MEETMHMHLRAKLAKRGRTFRKYGRHAGRKAGKPLTISVPAPTKVPLE